MGRPHPESERPLHAPLQSFDVGREVERLRGEPEWREGRRNAITLRKGEGFSVVLLVLREGDRLAEHSAPGPISVAVREGRINFTTADEAVEAGTHSLITCEAGVVHAVEALEDAVCVVSIAGSDRTERHP